MAFIKRAFQRGIAKRKLSSEKELDRVNAALTLRDVGGQQSLEKLILGLEDPSWNVRNACSLAISTIYGKKPNRELVTLLHKEIEEASLAKKLALVEVLGRIGHNDSLKKLLDLLKKSKEDLQYAVIIALASWANLDLLPALIDAGNTKDYLTRRAALMTSYNIIVDALENTTLNELMLYFHWIVQIYVETGYLGPLILRFLGVQKEDINQKIFPVALNEYEFTFLNELLDEVDFDPKKYEILHELAYPLLF
ncbi:MAG TPA: HEAT repeat domain-containing protein [candidate division Zixibacteria bacterium]|nr:HEAT repeat domain-containing protein [candidate division Zixibacteria bacterium]